MPFGNVVESNEVDVLPSAVFRDFQKIKNSKESGSLGQLGGDIREPDGFDRIHFDFSVCVHRIPPAHFDVWACPDADAAGDVSPANPFP
jgi:hypothetical protein